MTDWFEEQLHPGLSQRLSMDRVLFREKTEHQDLVIFENRVFGRVLALDGVVQTTEGDEFIYHEMLSHVPILAHGAATRVLIIGGGDGGMAREALKHPGIDEVT
ncbi:MAG: polyamine aminopropyltransferase, partial [Alphaproteobacteria bacterium]|nr:polyamine aminopropyltransferase [Alphaproteobacteria bacterium]